ncbi:MAG: site-specific integrase [Bacteroidetes bacterium]|nr:site-specific integrase [Bacteroidota bacterium]
MTTAKLLLYESKTLSNGKHPLCIRLIKDRTIKYISVGYSASKEQWNGSELLKGYPNFIRTNKILRTKLNEVEDVILNLEDSGRSYSLEQVEHKFLGTIKKKTVFIYCQDIIDRLKETHKIGNSVIYKDLLRTLKLFRNNRDLSFSDIDYGFLMKFEEFFLSRKVSENSISLYMRTLRALVNKAINEGYCKKEDYAFDKYKVSKLDTSTQKRAITKEEILKIINFETEAGTSLMHSKNFFLFSFYTIGMNFTDMANLRWKNIISNRIIFIRAKNKKLFDIKIQPRCQEILDYYSQENKNEEDYIFPILNDKIHNNLSSIRDRLHKVNKRVNKDLQAIAKKLKIDATHSITHYVARHSWASIQKENGVSTAIISESMQHDSEKTTQIYLKSFVNKVLDDANASII